ncbi:MAG: hypothetical protein ACI8PZ_001643, partial [Myxococcota bacterium]
TGRGEGRGGNSGEWQAKSEENYGAHEQLQRLVNVKRLRGGAAAL